MLMQGIVDGCLAAIRSQTRGDLVSVEAVSPQDDGLQQQPRGKQRDG